MGKQPLHKAQSGQRTCHLQIKHFLVFRFYEVKPDLPKRINQYGSFYEKHTSNTDMTSFGE